MEAWLLAIAMICKVERPRWPFDMQKLQRECAAEIVECLTAGTMKTKEIALCIKPKPEPPKESEER